MSKFRHLYTYLILAAVLLAGCLTQMSNPRQSAPTRNLAIIADTEDARVEVIDIIQPGDPTSWVDNARWTEVILKVSNKSPGDLMLRDAKLVDQRGVVLSRISNVISATNVQDQMTQIQQTQMGYGLAQGALGTGLGLGYLVPGLGYVAPFLAQGLSMAQQQSMLSVQNEPKRVQEEAQRRALPSTSTMISGGDIQGSLFFSQAGSPRRLTIEYVAGGSLKTLTIPLTSTGTAGSTTTTPESTIGAIAPENPSVAIAPTAKTLPVSANPFVEIVANAANIRDRPKSGTIIKIVKKGQRLEKLDEVDGWTKVLIDGDQVGWISSQLIKVVTAKIDTTNPALATSTSVGGIRSARDDALVVTLNEAIFPNGPGSWIQDAKWDEFVVTITNVGNEDLDIQTINLIDGRGVYVQQKRPSGAEMRPSMAEQIREHERIAPEIRQWGMQRAWAAQFGGPIPPPPQTSISVEQQVQKTETIEKLVKTRAIPVQVRLSGRGSITGSLFFPPSEQQPRALVLIYRDGSKQSELKLPLSGK